MVLFLDSSSNPKKLIVTLLDKEDDLIEEDVILWVAMPTPYTPTIRALFTSQLPCRHVLECYLWYTKFRQSHLIFESLEVQLIIICIFNPFSRSNTLTLLSHHGWDTILGLISQHATLITSSYHSTRNGLKTFLATTKRDLSNGGTTMDCTHLYSPMIWVSPFSKNSANLDAILPTPFAQRAMIC